jgi:hypothetical protein
VSAARDPDKIGPVDELIQKLVEKCGLSEDKARTVAKFIEENADEIPKWIGKSGVLDKVPGGDKLSGLF